MILLPVITDLQSLSCPVCKQNYLNLSALNKHLRLNHNKYPCYECSKCSYISKFRKHVVNHAKVKHNINISYICHICKKTFAKGVNLKHHMNGRHNQIFDYKCPFERICQYQSTRKDSITAHVKVKHLQMYQYYCQKCHKYRTNNKNHLECHERKYCKGEIVL